MWASDSTYTGNRGKHTYLCLVTDACSKKIVSYDMSDSLSAEWAMRVSKMVVKQKGSEESLIHHYDRGIQCCCGGYQRLLKKHWIRCSMTEFYDPYANAVAKKVNRILIGKILLDENRVEVKTMKKLVKESIDIYNTMRPHYSNFMLTPEQMHRESEIEMRTYKKKGRYMNEHATAKNVRLK